MTCGIGYGANDGRGLVSGGLRMAWSEADQLRLPWASTTAVSEVTASLSRSCWQECRTWHVNDMLMRHLKRMPRVAYFPDSFHEVNGVAHTSRHFEAFARRRNLPFLCVRAGDRTQAILEDGNVWTLELPRGFLSFALEKDLRFDPAFLRHIPLIGEVLERFKPDLIHITGPSEVGMLGAGLAHHLDLPLAASWHTNVHEYAARRSDWFLRLLPEAAIGGDGAEDRRPGDGRGGQVLFGGAGAVCAQSGALRAAGADDRAALPPDAARRGRRAFSSGQTQARRRKDRDQVLGFVGRLSIEKNVTLLAQVQEELERWATEVSAS